LADMDAWARDAEGAGHPSESPPTIAAETVAAR